MHVENCSPVASSIVDASKRLSLSRAMLYRLIATGDIRPFKVGKRTLIAECELQRFVVQRMSKGAHA